MTVQLFYLVPTISAAGVVPCVGPKTSTSSVVLIIFSFWSFKVS